MSVLKQLRLDLNAKRPVAPDEIDCDALRDAEYGVSR